MSNMVEWPDFRRDGNVWDHLEQLEEEIEGRDEFKWQQALRAAIEEDDTERVFFLLGDGIEFYFYRLPKDIEIGVQVLQDRLNEELENEIFSRWDEYIFPEESGGKFSRLQVQKKYQAKDKEHGRAAESRNYNAPKFRLIKKNLMKLDKTDLLDIEPIDTTPTGIGVEFQTEIVFESEPRDNRLQKKPQTKPPLQRHDYRTRRCAPMTSKSSPFNKIIETKEV